jgi:hypothetical protein
MLEQDRLSCNPSHASRAEQFREGNEQMDRQDEQIAHELEIILPANLHKTAPRRRFMPNLPIRHPQGQLSVSRTLPTGELPKLMPPHKPENPASPMEASKWSQCSSLFLIFAGNKFSSHFKAGQELDVALVAADAALADAVLLC